MSLRKLRVQREIALLKQAGMRVDWDYEEGSWVLVRDFRLPSGLGRSSTDVLILIPPDYPNTPPNGIYVDQGLKLPSHYFEHKGTHNPLGDKGWAWYCFHAEGHTGGWRASTRILEGDNLLKYLKLTRTLMDLAVGLG